MPNLTYDEAVKRAARRGLSEEEAREWLRRQGFNVSAPSLEEKADELGVSFPEDSVQGGGDEPEEEGVPEGTETKPAPDGPWIPPPPTFPRMPDELGRWLLRYYENYREQMGWKSPWDAVTYLAGETAKVPALTQQISALGAQLAQHVSAQEHKLEARQADFERRVQPEAKRMAEEMSRPLRERADGLAKELESVRAAHTATVRRRDELEVRLRGRAGCQQRAFDAQAQLEQSQRTIAAVTWDRDSRVDELLQARKQEAELKGELEGVMRERDEGVKERAQLRDDRDRVVKRLVVAAGGTPTLEGLANVMERAVTAEVKEEFQKLDRQFEEESRRIDEQIKKELTGLASKWAPTTPARPYNESEGEGKARSRLKW